MRRRAQRGLSLIETIVAVALLGVVVVAVLAAFSAAAIAAARHRDQSTLDLLTRSEAEYVKSQTYSFQPAFYSDLPGLPSGFTITHQVLYYSAGSGTFSTTNGDDGLQKVLATVRAPSGVVETVYIMKVNTTP